MRGFTESEVLDFVALARRKAYSVRWIEFMPLDADQIWRKEDILTGAEIKAIIEDSYGPLVQVKGDDASETARRYTFADGVTVYASLPRASCGRASSPSPRPICAQSCVRARAMRRWRA